MRVNVFFDDELLTEIDKTAKKFHMSRSAFISFCCSYCMIAPIGLTDIATKKFLYKGIKNGKIEVNDDESG